MCVFGCVNICMHVWMCIVYAYTHGFTLLEQKLDESNPEKFFKGGLGMLCGWKREAIFTDVENTVMFVLPMLFTNFIFKIIKLRKRVFVALPGVFLCTFR